MSSSTASLKWKQSLVLCPVDLWNLKNLDLSVPLPSMTGVNQWYSLLGIRCWCSLGRSFPLLYSMECTSRIFQGVSFFFSLRHHLEVCCRIWIFSSQPRLPTTFLHSLYRIEPVLATLMFLGTFSSSFTLNMLSARSPFLKMKHLRMSLDPLILITIFWFCTKLKFKSKPKLP